MEINTLSVFFPAYNEEKNIPNTVEKAVEVIKKLGLKDYEIIVINDGSKDRTAEVTAELQKGNSHIRLINHESNKGYGEAIKTGLYNARFPWIVYTDSDGQLDFAEVTKFLEKADGVDMVVGYRIDRQDPAIRRLFGWGWTLLSNILLGIGVRDVDCAFKLIKKEIVEKIPHLESSRGGMISPELLAKVKKMGFKVEEVGVHHYPRQAGNPTGADVKVILKSFIDLGRLWWKIR